MERTLGNSDIPIVINVSTADNLPFRLIWTGSNQLDSQLRYYLSV